MAYVAGGAALHFYTGARVSEEALPDCVGNRNRIKPSIGIACRLVVAAKTRGHIRVFAVRSAVAGRGAGMLASLSFCPPP